MSQALRTLVAERAGHCCEYCRLRDEFVPATFHIEHIIPKQHGGSDGPENRAYACNRCNLHKGPNLAGIDGDTQQVVPLFDPRRQVWDEHFALQGPIIVGITATGRATVQVLQMNAARRVRLRARLIARGVFP